MDQYNIVRKLHAIFLSPSFLIILTLTIYFSMWEVGPLPPGVKVALLLPSKQGYNESLI